MKKSSKLNFAKKQLAPTIAQPSTFGKFISLSTQTLSSTPRVLSSYYNSLPAPVRTILSIPVTGVKFIQENTFPTILFTEGYQILRQNFGFPKQQLAQSLFLAGLIYLQSPDDLIRNLLLGALLIGIASKSFESKLNNLCLYGMVICTVSRLYMNPLYFEKWEEVDAVWNQIDNKTISDEEFTSSFYNALWDFAKVIGLCALIDATNSFCLSLINKRIVFNKHLKFIRDGLSNYSAFGIKAVKDSNREKVNLNPVQLFRDIETQNMIFSLCTNRINSTLNLYSAVEGLIKISSPITVPLYFGVINLPNLLVMSVIYSLLYNFLISRFDVPLTSLLQKMNQLGDRITSQITNTNSNAELIAFHEGEDFELKKSEDVLRKSHNLSIKQNSLISVKSLMLDFIGQFQNFLPKIATLDSLRAGIIKREEIWTCYMHHIRINSFLTWVIDNFDTLSAIKESARRNNLYEEGFQAWNASRFEIAQKVIHSDIISFAGSTFYTDEKQKQILLAQGSFTLKPGTITHFDAPSGCGKTTLFRIFRGIWNEFTGKCTLPKNTVFLPSNPYILALDEPLFQSICYPVKYNQLTSHLEFIKSLLLESELDLPEHVYNNLISLPPEGDEKSQKTSFDWMLTLSGGQRKRLAFCNVLLKLRTQEVKFLVLDEPFSNVGPKKQATMIKILKDTIAEFNPDCAVLYSNHEINLNFGFKTHTLTVDEQTKEYKYYKN